MLSKLRGFFGPSRKELLQEIDDLNQICADYHRRIEELEEIVANTPVSDVGSAKLDCVLKIVENQIKEA